MYDLDGAGNLQMHNAAILKGTAADLYNVIGDLVSLGMRKHLNELVMWIVVKVEIKCIS